MVWGKKKSAQLQETMTVSLKPGSSLDVSSLRNDFWLQRGSQKNVAFKHHKNFRPHFLKVKNLFRCISVTL